VADGLEEWFGDRAGDGSVLAATHMPGAYEDFVRLMVPELQRGGLFTGTTRGHDTARAPGPVPAALGRVGAGDLIAVPSAGQAVGALTFRPDMANVTM
jgi:hypothetical protein